MNSNKITVVEEVHVKLFVTSELFGYNFVLNLTAVSPVCSIKSGINLLILIINSPSPLMSGMPTVCPVLLLRCVMSKSPDLIDAIIAVVAPPERT